MNTNDQVFLPGSNGKAVLLMHGLTSGAAQMVPMARYLNDYGYAVRCVNLAGHGTYPEDLLHTTAEDLIAKAEYDFTQMRAEYDNIYAGGVSTGGLLSLYLAATHPELAGIVPISAPIWLCPGSFISQAYPKGAVWLDRPLGIKPGLFRKYHIHYETIAISIFDELRRLMEKVRDPRLLAEVRCPALVIQAEDDDIAEPKSAEYVLKNISSSRKDFYFPSTGGHLCMLNDGCYSVFDQILKFLERD